MVDKVEEAVRILRGLKEDVDRLKGQREGEGQVQGFQVVKDQTNTSDTVTVRENDRDVTDQTNTSDTVTTRENDRSVTDQTNTSDTVNTQSGQPADFVWVNHLLPFENPLTITSGNTYTIGAGQSESHGIADIDGTLDLDGTLTITGERQDRTGDQWGLTEWQVHS